VVLARKELVGMRRGWRSLKDYRVGEHMSRGTLLRQGCGEQAERGAQYSNNYCIWVQLVKDYFKWFGWREIARCLGNVPSPVSQSANTPVRYIVNLGG
jgi:hypothetical protein